MINGIRNVFIGLSAGSALASGAAGWGTYALSQPVVLAVQSNTPIVEMGIGTVFYAAATVVCGLATVSLAGMATVTGLQAVGVSIMDKKFDSLTRSL